MKAVIGIENGEIVARLYIGRKSDMHINYGVNVTKNYVLRGLAEMGHEVIEPWELLGVDGGSKHLPASIDTTTGEG